ncbi:MAG: hypothetical protein CL532_04470 [Aestuariivita sp.]|nr:hypothetical protein [Aestuariivita sp.]
MRQLLLILFFIPNISLADTDVRELYVRAVEDFSTCGNALMPWGNSTWQPDEAERPYVEQAKINQNKMKSEVDEDFYSKANLEKLFVALTANFHEETAVITAELKKLPSEDHSVIWLSLFELEKEARLVREKLASDFRLHAEIIKMCSTKLDEASS